MGEPLIGESLLAPLFIERLLCHLLLIGLLLISLVSFDCLLEAPFRAYWRLHFVQCASECCFNHPAHFGFRFGATRRKPHHARRNDALSVKPKLHSFESKGQTRD
jgi:hypothetical protein